MTESALEFVAEAIDGQAYSYDDGWIIQVSTGNKVIRFYYSLEGVLETTKVSEE